jgi:hypothetical protein
VHHITRAWYTDCQPEKRVQVPRSSRCTGENRRLTAASYGALWTTSRGPGVICWAAADETRNRVKTVP